MYLNKTQMALLGTKYLNKISMFVKGALEPVINYVARLNGTDQYWQLSEAVTASPTDDFNLKLNAVRVEPSGGRFIFSSMSGDDYGINLYSTGDFGGGQGNISIFGGAGMPFIDGLSSDVPLDIELSRISGVWSLSVNGVVSSTTPNSTPPAISTSAESTIFSRASGGFILSGFCKDFEFYINEVLVNKIPLTNKTQGAYQVATTTPLGANLYTQEVIENPASANDQWTYLGDGRWQLIGDGSANSLQFLLTSEMPTTGYVQFEIESISGGTMSCSVGFVQNARFGSVGVKSYYYSDISEPTAIQFKRSSGSINLVIKNIKHYDAEDALVAEMVGYTPDVWEVVNPEPVNYMARLSEGRYYSLSENIDILGGSTLELEVETPSTLYTDSILSFFDTVDRDRIRVFEGDVFNIGGVTVFVDGERVYTGDPVAKSSGFTLSAQVSSNMTLRNIASDSGGNSTWNGLVVKSIAVKDSQGVLLNQIPLTNKSQGATQLPTVGNVSATMIGYTGDEWEEV